MPTIDVPEKICPHCGGTRWIIEYESRPSKVSPNYVRKRYRCYLKSKERKYKWIENNPDKMIEYCKKAIIKKHDNHYYTSINYKNYSKKRHALDSSNLNDRYIKYLLRHDVKIRGVEISQDLIELKRKQLLLTRQLRKL